MTTDPAPLDGITVLDLSRMLPGAVLARQLIDLGARLIKIEEPGAGDPLRLPPPHSEGVSVVFATLLRGAESLCLDLREAADADRLRALAGHADILVESFRPGTMEGWGLGAERLLESHPALVWCSLTSFGRSCSQAERIGHDLNFIAETGALRLLRETGVPQLQLADVGGALLASSAILAALLKRERSGRGMIVDQPLAIAPMPFLAFAWADAAAGGLGVPGIMLGGVLPCYRSYRCADGGELSVAALEPKFWLGLVEALGLPELGDAGHDPGDEGARAAEQLAEVFASRPREHWLGLAAQHGLPLAPVLSVAEARGAPLAELLSEQTPMPDGSTLATAGPFLPSLGRTPDRAAPQLGEHTEAILAEFGVG